MSRFEHVSTVLCIPASCTSISFPGKLESRDRVDLSMDPSFQSGRREGGSGRGASAAGREVSQSLSQPGQRRFHASMETHGMLAHAASSDHSSSRPPGAGPQETLFQPCSCGMRATCPAPEGHSRPSLSGRGALCCQLGASQAPSRESGIQGPGAGLTDG